MNARSVAAELADEPLPTPPAAWLPRRLHNLLMAAIFLVVCFSLARFGARWSAWCELFSHFPLQYGLLLLLGAAYAFVIGAPRNALAMLAFAGLNLSLLLPFAISHAPPPAPRDVIPIASVNVLYKNRDYRQTLHFVESANPDVLVVSEVDDQWLGALDSLNYPYREKFPQSDWLGMGLYSRFEIKSREVYPKGSIDPYACAWTLKVNGGELVVIGVHPPPPSIPPTAARQGMLHDIAELAAKYSQSKPTVLIGDLNVTPWSPYFESMKLKASLADARVGQGLRLSWPSQIPPLWIPIDHCLLSKHVISHGFWTGDSVGSDHLPIVCRVSIRDASNSTTVPSPE